MAAAYGGHGARPGGPVGAVPRIASEHELREVEHPE